MARTIHWDLSGKCGFERNERWYDHVPESVLENDDYKLLRDYSVRTDHENGARRPDLMIIDKRQELSNYRCGNSGGWKGEREGR